MSIELWSDQAKLTLALGVASAVKNKYKVDELTEAVDKALASVQGAEQAYQRAEAEVGIAKRNLKAAEAHKASVIDYLKAEILTESKAKMTEAQLEAQVIMASREDKAMAEASGAIRKALDTLDAAERTAADAKATVNTVRQTLSVADLKIRLVIARIEVFQGLDHNPPPPAAALAGHQQKEG